MEVRKPIEQRIDRDRRLHPGQRHAQTDVRACAERQMRDVLPGRVEAVGIG
jgi:hypothetical protein